MRTTWASRHMNIKRNTSSRQFYTELDVRIVIIQLDEFVDVDCTHKDSIANFCCSSYTFTTMNHVRFTKSSLLYYIMKLGKNSEIYFAIYWANLKLMYFGWSSWFSIISDHNGESLLAEEICFSSGINEFLLAIKPIKSICVQLFKHSLERRCWPRSLRKKKSRTKFIFHEKCRKWGVSILLFETNLSFTYLQNDSFLTSNAEISSLYKVNNQ